MSYLIQPPAQSVDACNPLFTYSVEDPTREEMSHILDLRDWGWEVSLHRPNDLLYLEAMEETERAIKKRRRLTQFVDGDCLGGAPRMTLEQIWIGEAERRLRAGLFVVEEEERGMERLKEWRGEPLETVSEEPHGWQMAEVELLRFPTNEATEVQEPDTNISKVIDKRSSPQRPVLGEEQDWEEDTISVLWAVAGRLFRDSYVSISLSIEEPEQESYPDAPATKQTAHGQSFEHDDESHIEVVPRPTGQDIHENTSQQDTSEHDIEVEEHVTTHPASKGISNSLTITYNPPELMQYILNMPMSWCPRPIFFRTWSKSGELIQTAQPRSAEPPPQPDTETPPKTSKGSRVSFCKQRRNSESSASDWKSPTRWKPPKFITLRTFLRKERGNAAAEMVISELVLIHSTLDHPYPTQLIDIPQYNSNAALLHPGDALHTPSTTSSLIFPGRAISEKEYKKHTLRPRENLEPGFAERPADMEWKGVWDKWDEARGMDERVGRSYSWHEEWQRDVKEVEKRRERERRRAEKEKRDEERKVARQEKKEREERVVEEWRKKGYSARYV